MHHLPLSHIRIGCSAWCACTVLKWPVHSGKAHRVAFCLHPEPSGLFSRPQPSVELRSYLAICNVIVLASVSFSSLVTREIVSLLLLIAFCGFIPPSWVLTKYRNAGCRQHDSPLQIITGLLPFYLHYCRKSSILPLKEHIKAIRFTFTGLF